MRQLTPKTADADLIPEAVCRRAAAVLTDRRWYPISRAREQVLELQRQDNERERSTGSGELRCAYTGKIISVNEAWSRPFEDLCKGFEGIPTGPRIRERAVCRRAAIALSGAWVRLSQALDEFEAWKADRIPAQRKAG